MARMLGPRGSSSPEKRLHYTLELKEKQVGARRTETREHEGPARFEERDRRERCGPPRAGESRGAGAQEEEKRIDARPCCVKQEKKKKEADGAAPVRGRGPEEGFAAQSRPRERKTAQFSRRIEESAGRGRFDSRQKAGRAEAVWMDRVRQEIADAEQMGARDGALLSRHRC